jgi:hypothetical protein
MGHAKHMGEIQNPNKFWSEVYLQKRALEAR